MIMPVIKKSPRNVEASNTVDVLKMSEGKTLPVMVIFAIVAMRCSLQEIGAKAVNKRIFKFFF